MGHGDREASPAPPAIAQLLPGLGLGTIAPQALFAPLWNRILDGLSLRAANAGIAIAFSLVALVVAREAWLGRLEVALFDPADLYVSIVEALLVGYLVAARVSVARAARATLDALGDALDSSPARRAGLRREMGQYHRVRFLAAGLAGATLGVLAPLAIRDATIHPWSLADWSPEFALRRSLAPVVGWLFGTYVLATVREAARVSNLAHDLRSIDLFDCGALAPLSRFGLQVAFRAVGLVSLTALMITQRGLGLVVVCLVLIAALAAAAGLLLPVRGLRERILDEKRRELGCCREALRRARDSLVEGKPAAPDQGSLSEVVAYKQLVESIDEWPIDTPTVLRAGAYVGLPVLSWLSGTVAPSAILRVFALVLG